MTARLPCLALLVLCLSAAGASSGAAAVAPRASLTDVESQVMCVTCGVPLSIAESPQANQERDFIRGAIARGQTAAQIKQELVAQLGPEVLALPARSGFNLAVYIVPVLLIALLAAMLAVALPRWRRNGAAGDEEDPPAGDALSPDDDARLEAELARYER